MKRKEYTTFSTRLENKIKSLSKHKPTIKKINMPAKKQKTLKRLLTQTIAHLKAEKKNLELAEEIENLLLKHGRTKYALVQEDENSGWLYLHGWDTLKEAERYRNSCNKAGYRTGRIVKVPPFFFALDGGTDTVDTLLHSIKDLD